MNKITLSILCTLTIFIGGCSHTQKESETKHEQNLEQTSTETKQDSKTSDNVKKAPTFLNGNEDYLEVIAYNFQKELKHKNGTVYFYKGILSVVLTVSKSDIDEATSQDLSNSVHDLKNLVIEDYNSDHKSYKKADLIIFDKDGNEISYEKNNSMILK